MHERAQMRQIRLTCSDLARSIAWYEALGFVVLAGPTRARWPGAAFGIDEDADITSAVLATPHDTGFWLVLTQWHEPPSVGAAYPEAYHRGLFRMALSTDDAQVAAAAAHAAGLTVTHEPEDVALKGTPIESMWILFLRDPDGFLVELVERPRSAFPRGALIRSRHASGSPRASPAAG